MIAVRACRRAADGGVLVVLDREHEAVLSTAAYAVALAQAVRDVGFDVSLVEIDVSLLGSSPPGVVLDVRMDGRAETPGSLGSEAAAELARRVLGEPVGAPLRRLGEASVGRVVLEGVASVPADPPVEAPQVSPSVRAESPVDAAQVSPSVRAESPVDAAQVSPLVRAESPRRTALAPVVLTVAALLVVAVAWSVLPRGAGDQGPGPVADVPERSPAAALTIQQVEVVSTAATAAPELAAASAVPPTTTPEPATATPVVLAATGVPPTAAPSPQAPLFDFAPGRSSGLTWPNDPRGTAFFGPDGYHLASRTPGQFVAVGLLPNQSGGVVSATFHKVGGPPGGGYGIIVDDQGSGPRDGMNQQGTYLVFEVDDRGETGAWRRKTDVWDDILPWTPNAAVRPDNAENTLELRLGSGEVIFSVNGTVILTHAQTVAGGIGVFLGGDGDEAVLTRLTMSGRP